MNETTKIAAAVAAILGAGSAFAAGPVPTLSEAAAPNVSLYVAGSSAAKNAVTTALLTNMCGGAANALNITSVSNTNFGAVSCRPGAGTAQGNGALVFTVFYRFEGGSVTGALPIANNLAIATLDLTKTAFITCGTTTCSATVTGTSAANGTTDTFGGAVSDHAINAGILDVEPAALGTAANYPTPYSTTVWGAANPSGVAALPSAILFDQVFGIYVNTNAGVGLRNPLNLSVATVASILHKTVSDWSQVTDTNGLPALTSGSASTPIVLVNREQGSGSRAATDLLIAGDTCQSQGSALKENTNKNFTDYFSTGDVLTALSTNPGGISYATIDNAPKANEVLVNLNGITPTNLAAAAGAYPFWVESTIVSNSGGNAPDATLFTFFTSTLQTIGTAPHLASILANSTVPTGAANVAHVNTSANGDVDSTLGPATIYTNPSIRSKVTCALPTSNATAL